MKIEIEREEDGRRIFAWLTADSRARDAWTDALGRSAQLRVRLRIDATAPLLHTLPWETLRATRVDGAEFDVAASAETPFSRYLATTREHGVPVDLPLRIVVAIAAPENLGSLGLAAIDADAEWAALECDRRGGTRLRMTTSCPAAAAVTATRSPASPAPMTRRSV